MTVTTPGRMVFNLFCTPSGGPPSSVGKHDDNKTTGL